MEEKDEIQRAWSRVFEGEYGKVIKQELEYFLLMDCHVPGDPYATAYNAGRQTLARNILILGGQYE